MDDGDHGDHRDHGDSRADMGTTGTTLTVHVEEGLRRVLPGAAARPARVLPLVGGLHRPETQRPALHHRPRRQRACDDTAPCHPPVTMSPSPVPVSPLAPAPTEPLEGGRGVAGAHAAELGRLPRCHAQLRRLHGSGGGGGGAGCGETQGGGVRAHQGHPRPPTPPPWCHPQAVGAVGSREIGVARLARWGARWSCGVQRVSGGAHPSPLPPCHGDSPGLCPSMNSTGP